jgi:hypothetical protein
VKYKGQTAGQENEGGLHFPTDSSVDADISVVYETQEGPSSLSSGA